MANQFNLIVEKVISPLLFLLSKNQTAIILLILYIFFIIVLILFNPFNILTNYSQVIFPFIISFGLLNVSLFILYKLKNGNYRVLREIGTIVFSIIFIFIFVIIALFVLINYFINSVFIIIGSLFLIASLALIYLYINPSNASSSTGPGITVFTILKDFIFYIPCLFYNLIEYVSLELKLTKKPIWILLLIELILIILLGALPFIFKSFSSHDGKTILKNPKYLNNRIDLGTFKSLGIGFKDRTKDEKKKKNPIYKYNFAISSWIWINPQSNSTSKVYNKIGSLLNYGNVFFIKYKNNKFEVYAKQGDGDNKLIYKSKNVLFQRWNNFVINYYGGTLDLFINNKLVLSQINILPIFQNSKILAGQKDGINGGIRNVVYYNNVISRNKIRTIYNLDNF